MPLPSRVLVFGASGRIGSAVAGFVAKTQPDIRLRLVTSRPSHVAALVEKFPDAEVVNASYFDPKAMTFALNNVEAAFVVTPTFIDEKAAMSNFITTALQHGSLRHFIRIVGDPPGMRLERVPKVLKDFGGGTAIQHLIARDMLERSGLPVTYLNITNSFMDNFLGVIDQLKSGYWLAPTDRLIGYVDPAEVGEAAARILLSRDRRHIFQHYNLDNGEKPRRNSAVVRLMEEIFGHQIDLVISPTRFVEEIGPIINRRCGITRGGEFMVEYMRFEEENELSWRQSDFLESILGRAARTLVEWFKMHRDLFAQT